MFKDEGMEQALMDMANNRSDLLLVKKGHTNERYLKFQKEKDEAREKLTKDFTEEQKKAFAEYDEADAAVYGISYNYVYLQGLRDGVTLANVV